MEVSTVGRCRRYYLQPGRGEEEPGGETPMGPSLAAGPDMADGRGPVPIVTAGSGFIPVLAVHHPRSRLGHWVELQVQVPPERLGVAAR